MSSNSDLFPYKEGLLPKPVVVDNTDGKLFDVVAQENIGRHFPSRAI